MSARTHVPSPSPARPQPSFKRAKKFQPKPRRATILPRLVRYVLMFLSVVIVIDALFGDRGFLDTLRARRDYAALGAHVARLKADNVRLRAEARRLKEDPLAVESIARERLGLIYPGETLFIVKDRTLGPR